MDKKFNSIRYAEDFPVNEVEEIRIKQILDLVGGNKKVLDIGCGDAFIMERIRDNNNEVMGIEIAENAVEKSRKKGFKVFDISLNDNWADEINNRFDVVFAGEIIEHIFDTDKFLSNIKKVLNKNGRVVITTPNIASLGRRVLLLFGESPLLEVTARAYDAGHIRYFTQKTLVRLLKENGYRAVNVQSSVVNFNGVGNLYSRLVAQVFPKLGNNIILTAIINE